MVPLHETQPDKTWDALTELASEAWSWRDPESLARLEGCIRRLWAEVERDWHSSD